MRKNRYSTVVLATLASLVFSAHASAASFCVDTVAKLSTALATAQSNGLDDVIYIVSGTYFFTTDAQYVAPPAETHGLTIIGGLAPGCLTFAGTTVLDGQNTTRILTIDARGLIDIQNITFQHANAAQYYGGAINLANESVQDIRILSNQFIANKAVVGAGGALYVSTATQGNLYLLSNIFLANSGEGVGAVSLYGNGNSFVTGNTFLANVLNNHTGLGGLDLTGGGYYWISNNILWNDEGVDVYDQVGHAYFANNDIGTLGGFPPLSASNELSVVPDFDGPFSLRPAPDSPLVNTGLDTAPGAIGCCDAVGAPRQQGKHVDIGAIETDVLFRDGFGA